MTNQVACPRCGHTSKFGEIAPHYCGFHECKCNHDWHTPTGHAGHDVLPVEPQPMERHNETASAGMSTTRTEHLAVPYNGTEDSRFNGAQTKEQDPNKAQADWDWWFNRTPEDRIRLIQQCRAAEPVPAVPQGAEPMTAEQLAQKFHDTYERLAPQMGYTTRRESAKPWSDVPDKNRILMIATCQEIINDLTRAAASPAGNAELKAKIAQVERERDQARRERDEEMLSAAKRYDDAVQHLQKQCYSYCTRMEKAESERDQAREELRKFGYCASDAAVPPSEDAPATPHDGKCIACGAYSGVSVICQDCYDAAVKREKAVASAAQSSKKRSHERD